MARTQAADYDERKQAIVEAAAALFASRGFNGASVADVAEHCQTSKSLIYHYYQSKEDILHDVMISHVHALSAAATDAMSGSGSPEQKLRDLTQLFMALYIGAADRHKVLLNDLDELPEPRRAEIVAVQRGLIENVRTLLVGIEPKLKTQPGGGFAAAMLFFGTINWTHTWYDPKGAVGPEALADMAVDLILGGISRAAES